MSHLLAEIVFAFRHLRRAPAFTLLAIALLAFGIGANVAMFSILRSILLRPLPYPESNRLVGIEALNTAKGIRQPALSLSDFRDFRGRVQCYSGFAAFRPDFVGYAPRDADPIQWVCGKVTEEFFETFGVRPLLGRTFSRTEFSGGGERVVVLSRGAWARHFNESPDVLGAVVLLDDVPATVVGVMPADFREPEFADVWVPFPEDAPENFARDSRFWTTVARLKSGVSVEKAGAEAAMISAALSNEYPVTNRGWSATARPLLEMRVSGLRSSLWLLVAAVGSVLLVVCINLANLMLARGVARLQELGVRMSLGATPGMLARSVVVESLLLSTAGCIAGLLLACVLVPVVSARLPVGLVPRSHAVEVDMPALGFAVALCLVTGLGFGVLPALQVLRANVNEVLKSGGRAVSSRFTHLAQSGLIVAQVALTMTVLTGAALLMKNLLTLQRTPVGFDPADVVTVRISPPTSRWENFRELARYYERVLAELRALPGVQGADLNCSAPLGEVTLRYPFWVEGRLVEEGQSDEAVFNAVGTDYFRVLRVPVLRGRVFSQNDDLASGSKPVCIINRTMARRLFGNDDPIGRRIRTVPWMVREYREIVGVVGDVKQVSQSDVPVPQIYVPQAQSPWFFSSLVVRTDRLSADAIRSAIRRVEPTLTMSIRTMDEAIARSATQPRLRAQLFAWFGFVALAVSAFGIYASISFTVVQRTREIGLRLALGAAPSSIVGWVLWRAMRLAATGVVIGLVFATALRHALDGMLQDGAAAADPILVASLAVFLPVVVLGAALNPARRAAALEPAVAIQAE